MKLQLEITIPGKDTRELRRRMVAILIETAIHFPHDKAARGQCYGDREGEGGHYFFISDPKPHKELKK